MRHCVVARMLLIYAQRLCHLLLMGFLRVIDSSHAVRNLIFMGGAGLPAGLPQQSSLILRLWGSLTPDAPITIENSGISPILGVGYERYFNDSIGFKVEIAPFKVEYKSGKKSYTTGLELGLFYAF